MALGAPNVWMKRAGENVGFFVLSQQNAPTSLTQIVSVDAWLLHLEVKNPTVANGGTGNTLNILLQDGNANDFEDAVLAPGGFLEREIRAPANRGRSPSYWLAAGGAVTVRAKR